MSLPYGNEIMERELANLLCNDQELASTPAYMEGPEIKSVRDAEFLAMLLDPSHDIFIGLIIRNADGTFNSTIEGKELPVRATLGRARRLLRGYEPTTRPDRQALLSALYGYGLTHEARKLKREHDL